MCGVVGIVGPGRVNQQIYDALPLSSIAAKMPQVS